MTHANSRQIVQNKPQPQDSRRISQSPALFRSTPRHHQLVDADAPDGRLRGGRRARNRAQTRRRVPPHEHERCLHRGPVSGVRQRGGRLHRQIDASTRTQPARRRHRGQVLRRVPQRPPLRGRADVGRHRRGAVPHVPGTRDRGGGERGGPRRDPLRGWGQDRRRVHGGLVRTMRRVRGGRGAAVRRGQRRHVRRNGQTRTRGASSRGQADPRRIHRSFRRPRKLWRQDPGVVSPGTRRAGDVRGGHDVRPDQRVRRGDGDQGRRRRPRGVGSVRGEDRESAGASSR